MSKNTVTYTLSIIGVVLLLLGMMYLLDNQYESAIEDKVGEVDGVVLSIESKVFDLGPFKYKTKEQYIYQFHYQQFGEVKEGWVRFGVFNDDWYLDGKWIK